MTDLATIRTFPQLIKYLKDELGWPITSVDFEDLFYEYTPQELGIDSKSAVKIKKIKRLRSLSVNQPWGVFFVEFEPKKLPIVALRRILSSVSLKQRASANSAERKGWEADDLLFISNYGDEGDGRKITFAHFAQDPVKNDLPTLKVLGWGNLSTSLRLDSTAEALREHLTWPTDTGDAESWRDQWSGAFTLRYREVITTSKDLATRLAALARAIRDLIKDAIAIENEKGPLTSLLKAFQEALVHDLDPEGFADMYAQTIAYGLLTARIANPKANTVDHLATQVPITNPFLKELMDAFIHVGGRRHGESGVGIDFDELGVSDIVALLDHSNMEAVVRDFGDRDEDPVIHFYEQFLKEYDAKKRLQRGVFYTPRPVVSYIVRSVDEMLRKEFGLKDGLADTATWAQMVERHSELAIPEGLAPDEPFIQILDPAAGTGTFLVEVIDLIHRRMVKKWSEDGANPDQIHASWNTYVAEHLLPRIYGYELLMAPYAIAHLKIGLKLFETGYDFTGPERVRVYLTNALEPPQDFSHVLQLAIPALAHESAAVNDVKAHRRFTVIIGNPPYSGFSANMNSWIDDLLHGRDGLDRASYYEVDGMPLNEKKLWLQDDYVKFIRLSQSLIEASHAGVHGFITNNSYLDGPTHRGMRFQLMQAFSDIQIVNMHGSGKRNRDADQSAEDENVFDIQQGVAIGLFARWPYPITSCEVGYRELWGKREGKYERLTTGNIDDLHALTPTTPWYLFVPSQLSDASEYVALYSLEEIFLSKSTSVQTSRDAFVIDFDDEELLARISELGVAALDDQYFRDRYGLKDGRNWALDGARQDIATAADVAGSIVPYLYRVFDTRYICYRDSLVNWPRHEVMDNLGVGNIALLIPRQLAGREFRHVFCTRELCDMCVVSTATKEAVQAHPLFLSQSSGGLLADNNLQPNLSSRFTQELVARLGVSWCGDAKRSADVSSSVGAWECFDYIYALLHSPAYRLRYEQFLRIDFPRIPLTSNRDLFQALCARGAELVSLHLMESSKLDHFGTTYSGPKNPQVGRVGWSDGTVWLDATPTTKGQSSGAGSIGFQGVPESVWRFSIGGYQVCEKWLKDRKGRILTADDLTHYQRIVVTLKEMIRLMGEIDGVIDKHGGWQSAFSVVNDLPGESSAVVVDTGELTFEDFA